MDPEDSDLREAVRRSLLDHEGAGSGVVSSGIGNISSGNNDSSRGFADAPELVDAGAGEGACKVASIDGILRQADDLVLRLKEAAIAPPTASEMMSNPVLATRRVNKSFLELEDGLERLILELDSIESESDQDVRTKRSDAVRTIQCLLDQLDALCTSRKKIKIRLSGVGGAGGGGGCGSSSRPPGRRSRPAHIPFLLGDEEVPVSPWSDKHGGWYWANYRTRAMPPRPSNWEELAQLEGQLNQNPKQRQNYEFSEQMMAQYDGNTCGKWLLWLKDTSDVWPKIHHAIVTGQLGPSAKISDEPLTAAGLHVVCVYCPDYRDAKYLRYVRYQLRSLGFDRPAQFKSDVLTLCDRKGSMYSL